MLRPRRRLSVLAAGALVLAGAVVGIAPATADHTDTPSRVTLMGTLMSELGCPADWSEDCTSTDLLPVAGSPGLFARTFTVPAGDYLYKVRLNGSWDENYGDATFGVADGNIPLPLTAPTTLRFTYDHATHRVRVGPAEAPSSRPTRTDARLAKDGLRKDLTRENFYFVMADRFANGSAGNDRGGLTGSRSATGFDPSDQGFYHGGDLKGLMKKLDYIEGLGTTAIWMTPSFKNKPVQGEPGSESAGYHGYWVTDFTQIDPHLGTNAELKQLIDLAHKRGIKVFFDIITNHTADVLDYPSSAYDETGQVPYKTKAESPYTDASGAPFDDRDFTMIGDDFPEVDAATSFPYVPTFRTEADKTAKVPAWLNDPTMYHNRGTSTFSGENSEYGDFPSGNRSALDDLWTERPQVVQGMIDVYKTWVKDAGVDGFRIDTVKHVNMDFWKQFGPALQGYAAQVGNKDFFMFGEVYDADPRFMSQYTTEGRLQATVDFGFQGSGVNFAKGKPTSEMRDFYALDDYFTDTDSNAYSLPTFLGNHDMGRVGSFLRQGTSWTDAQLLRRDELAHSLMYLTRGQPVVYYGDEQGFSAPSDVPGGIGDQRAREDMFPSKVALHNDTYDLIGTRATTADANYDTKHPLYRHIAELAKLRDKHPALADGAQVHRYASNEAGIFAFSRMDPDEKVEYVVAVNNAETAKSATFATYQPGRSTLKAVWPASAPKQLRTDAEGRVTVNVPPLSGVVYRATAKLRGDRVAPRPAFSAPGAAGIVTGRAEVGVTVPGGDFTQVTFAWRRVGTTGWTPLGTDDNAPYRVFHDVRGLAQGTPVEYRAIARDHDGDLGVVSTSAVVGQPQPPEEDGVVLGPITQPDAVSVPGSHGSEIGCGADWDPPCEDIQLALDDDQVWKGTFSPQAGQYAFKAAVNRSWDENYGSGAKRNGSDIAYTTDGGPVSFYFDYRTKWVTNTELDPVLVATGDFQSELGCPTDGDASCMRSWLQDPDRDGTYSFSTIGIPAGTWSVSVGSSGPQSFTVAEGEATTISFQRATSTIGVDTFVPDLGPDLSTARASWLTPNRVSWNLPDERGSWTYRLHYGPKGSLALDTETVGGSSVPLTLDRRGLPTWLADRYPDLADQEVLRLSSRDARDARKISRAGQVAVVAYDELGRVVQATGVEVVGRF
ncbi:alpha-amylase family glycosyl hydrolase [Phycicoccus avicenniae]|uniref:alpha-amylase family glycosyl hydrolase n=1 Tax=Phycicoccus avicenniae TaxID=2828860 RepID=UPI003D29515E